MNILARHFVTVAMMNRDRVTAFLLRDYFDLSRKETLMSALLSRGLGQADLVLSLLRLRDAAPGPDRRRLLSFYVRRLVGRPIQVCPSCLLLYRVNGHAPRASRPLPSDRKIIWVTDTNPRQPGTDAFLRWLEFRPGRTVAQLRARGVTRRDLRRAERRGWVRFEECAA